MMIAIPDIRSVSQVGRSFGAVTDEVESGRSILVVKNNRPVAAVVPPEALERLDGIAEREEDVRLLVMSLVRLATNDAPLRTLDAVASELGFDLDAIRAEVRDG